MFTKSAIVLAAVAGLASAADLTVSTPASLIQCQPALLAWSGGTAPYYLAAIPGSQPSAAAIKDFGEQSGNSLTWNVDLAAGTSITLKITDSSGAVNYNDAVSVQAGSSSDCLNAASSSAVASVNTSAATSTGAGAGAAVAASASSPAASSAARSAASPAAAAASSASAKPSSAAASGANAASSAKSSGTAAVASAAASASGKSGAGHSALANGAVVAVAAGVVGLLFA